MTTDQNSPRNTSTRTSLEVITRRIVDQAASELNHYLAKLPESAGPDPEPGTPAAETRERITALADQIARYLGRG